MKKLISFLLVITMVLSVGVISASTQTVEDKEFLYKDKFIELSGFTEYRPSDYDYHWDVFTYYDELYYHKNNESGEVDWVLMTVLVNIFNPTEAVFVTDVGDRLIKWWAPGVAAYPYGYAIYDVANDKLYDIWEAKSLNLDGLVEAFDELEIGYVRGDIDRDNTVSILDSTEIQLYLSQHKQWAREDYSYIPALGDVDEDGDMTVLDATTIQLNLAGISEKIYNQKLVYSKFNNMYGVDTGMEEILFETVLNRYDMVDTHKMDNNHFGAIIKSKEQYDSMFCVYQDKFDDEFFEDKWLVASVCTVLDAEAVAVISELYVRYDTLFMRVDEMTLDTDGIFEPIAPPFYSFVAVDKDDVNEVKQIIWI